MINLEQDRILTLDLFLKNCIKPKMFKELLQEEFSLEEIYTEYKKHSLDNLANLDISLKILSNLNISYLCLWEKEYPKKLKDINDPPILIFYKGNKEHFKQDSFSIVGSRRMSDYGKNSVKKFVEGFKYFNLNLVSGMAAGIDAEVHEQAIKNKIPTIAVLASSVSEPTPAFNTSLYDEILESDGLVISEQFPGYPIHKGHFPRRNRIIAGISLGTLVIEAHAKSGSLITARLANSYNRDVYALPDNIFNLNSMGSNRLIKEEKAKLVTESKDILDDQSLKAYYKRAIKMPVLNQIETIIYNELKKSSKTPEELANFLNIDFSVIISSCSIMEVKSLLSKNIKGQYFIN